MNPQAQTFYTSILHDNKLLPLSSFKSYKFSKYNLFPHAQTLPTFFENNLQSDGRIVKCLKGPQGPLRGFYYQLFKLGFQIEHSPPDYYANIIKNVIFDPSLASNLVSPMSGKQYNISQYQRIIAQFIKIMQAQVIPNAELTFSQYPIIDEAMLTILQLIVQKNHKRGDTLTEMLIKLSTIFNITLEVYENCLSFEESDVFLYVESHDSFYLAFLSEMAQVESFEKTSESPMEFDQKQQMSSISSYMQNMASNRESSVYKDIRLSAGNKGNKSKILNKSGGKQHKPGNYGSSSFGTYGQGKEIFDHNEYEDRFEPLETQSQSKQQQFEKPQEMQKNVFDFEEEQPVNVFENQGQSHNAYYHSQSNYDDVYGEVVCDSSKKYQKSIQVQSQQKVMIKSLPNQPSSQYKTEQIQPSQYYVPNMYNSYPYNKEKIKGENTYLIRQKLNDKGEIVSISKSSSDEAQGKMNVVSQELIPPLINAKSIQSISENYQKSRQRKNPLTESNGKQQKITQNYINNYNESRISPNYEIRTQRASVKLNNTIFQYQFKSHKYQSCTNQISTSISFNPIPTIQDKFIKSKQQADLVEKINGITNMGLNISAVDTANTFNHDGTFSTIRDHRLDTFHNYDPNETLRTNYLDINFYNPISQPSSRKKIMPQKTEQRYLTLEIDYNTDPGKRKDDSLGTFYREFSDTRIMEAMIEPCKSHVRKIRQKFKGIRSKNWRGFS